MRIAEGWGMIANVERKQSWGEEGRIYAYEFRMQGGKICYLKKQQSMSFKEKMLFQEGNHKHLWLAQQSTTSSTTCNRGWWQNEFHFQPL